MGVPGGDVARPHILVYERTARGWQLGALEWVFTTQPATPPLPGAAPRPAPPSTSGTRTLVTLHVWLWYHNPDGLYSGTTP